jgi:hypothetical protein
MPIRRQRGPEEEPYLATLDSLPKPIEEDDPRQTPHSCHGREEVDIVDRLEKDLPLLIE